MLKVGIDTIAFYTSHYALDLTNLAQARNIDPSKFYIGLGQQNMAVLAPDEDVVTLAANAALRAIRSIDPDLIEILLFATGSGIDQSKSAGIYVHHLLGLSAHCRVVELKQACYSGIFGLQLALSFLCQYPNKKILLIASDISRYGLGTSYESSQGCAAVAMILSSQPRILALDPEYGVVTENVMDFWRPNYSNIAFLQGKYSNKLYLTMLEKSWQRYYAWSGRGFHDHDYYCYHTPTPKLVEKAHQHFANINGQEHLTKYILYNKIGHTLEYGRKIGNCYTASLFVALTALLDLAKEDLSEKRVGFYSYGSGCVAEYFSGVIQHNYQKILDTEYHQKMLTERTTLTYQDYESFYRFSYPQDGSSCELPRHQTGCFRLAKICSHKRIYEKV